MREGGPISYDARPFGLFEPRLGGSYDAPKSDANSAICPPEREFFIDNLLVRIQLTIEMILVDRPCAMGV